MTMANLEIHPMTCGTRFCTRIENGWQWQADVSQSMMRNITFRDPYDPKRTRLTLCPLNRAEAADLAAFLAAVVDNWPGGQQHG